MTTPNLFTQLGGEVPLRAIMAEFVAAMTTDPMIGFFFAGVDHARLLEREYQFTAGFLGANVAYTGRPLRATHAAARIMGGQFDRRKKLLSQVLQRHGLPDDLRAAWLAHVEALRGQITGQSGAQCD